MRDLVQKAPAARTLDARMEKSAGRAADGGFADSLQIRTAKSATAKDGAEPAPALPPALRVKIGQHSFPARLPVVDLAQQELFQRVAVEQADETFEKPDPIAGDKAAGDHLSITRPHSFVSAGEVPVPEENSDIDEPSEEDRAAALAPASAATAVLIAPVTRFEYGVKPGRLSAAISDAPDSGEVLPAKNSAPGSDEPPPEKESLPVSREDIPQPSVAGGAVKPLVSPQRQADGDDLAASIPVLDKAYPAKPAALIPAPATSRKEPLPVVSRQDSPRQSIAVDPVEPIAAPERQTDDSPGETVFGLRDMPRSPSAGTQSNPSRTPDNVRIVESYSLPAPAQTPAATVSNAIAAAPDWLSVARSVIAQPAITSSSRAGPLKSLTIQLHPAELGVVTAKMRLAGEQISIELQVEKPEAYEKLTADRDSIVKAVRALGLEVDKITILQPNTQSGVNARTEIGAASSGGRETGFSMRDGSGGRESGAGGHSTRNGIDDPFSGSSGVGPVSQDGDGRGLYI